MANDPVRASVAAKREFCVTSVWDETTYDAVVALAANEDVVEYDDVTAVSENEDVVAFEANDAVVAFEANDAVVAFEAYVEVTDVEANDADAIEPDIMMVPVVAKLPDIFILPEKLTAML